jgi:hypothetical protein
VLAKAAKSGKGWFKSITVMENAALEVIGPAFADSAEPFQTTVLAVFSWIKDDC